MGPRRPGEMQGQGAGQFCSWKMELRAPGQVFLWLTPRPPLLDPSSLLSEADKADKSPSPPAEWPLLEPRGFWEKLKKSKIVKKFELLYPWASIPCEMRRGYKSHWPSNWIYQHQHVTAAQLLPQALKAQYMGNPQMPGFWSPILTKWRSNLGGLFTCFKYPFLHHAWR